MIFTETELWELEWVMRENELWEGMSYEREWVMKGNEILT